jgi:hypothetical protein
LRQPRAWVYPAHGSEWRAGLQPTGEQEGSPTLSISTDAGGSSRPGWPPPASAAAPVAAQTPGPWAARPAGNPQQLTFVVWQYGKIYTRSKQFEQDWNVKLNQIIEPNVEPQVASSRRCTRQATRWTSNRRSSTCRTIDQGIALPIDGLPGVDQYVKDFTPFTRATAQRDGKTWGCRTSDRGCSSTTTSC